MNTHCKTILSELIEKLKIDGTPENKWALTLLGIDNNTFVEILDKRSTHEIGIVPFDMVICDDPVNQFYNEDSLFLRQFGVGAWKHKWNTFVQGIRNHVRYDSFNSPVPVSPSASVSIDPQLFNPITPFTGSVSIERPKGGRKSSAKPRRKTNKNRNRRKSIKKLHRRK
jgi:hypothetical protein